jgi:hypothetical protein
MVIFNANVLNTNAASRTNQFRQNRAEFVKSTLQSKFGDEQTTENYLAPNHNIMDISALRRPENNPHLARMQQISQDMEAAREAAEAEAEFWRLMRKAMQIAARIMRGDNVPQQDYNFLAEKSPGLFMLAVSMRNHNNEDPKDYEALSDSANNQNNQNNLADTISALTAATAPSTPSAPATPSASAGVSMG